MAISKTHTPPPQAVEAYHSEEWISRGSFPQNSGGYATKFAPHKARRLTACCKLTFDERVELHRFATSWSRKWLTPTRGMTPSPVSPQGAAFSYEQGTPVRFGLVNMTRPEVNPQGICCKFVNFWSENDRSSISQPE